MILSVEHLTKRFEGIVAVDDVSFEVKQGEILGIIGANGAGKSTLLNTISGFYTASSGKVFFCGQDITKKRADEIVRLGCGRNFQSSLLFMNKTVIENIYMAQHVNYKTPIWKRALRLPEAKKEERILLENSRTLVRQMELGEVENEYARNLPHGYQRVLSVCVAMASTPKLLLLDEPLTGMNQTEISAMCRLLQRLRESGLTIVMIEHNMEAVMRICDRLVALNYGRKIADGLPAEVRQYPQVIESYLGKD